MLEQLREQYLERGRAGLQHSSQAHIPPDPSEVGAAFLATVFFNAVDRVFVLVTLFRDAAVGLDDGFVCGLWMSLSPISEAFFATIIFGRAGRLALVFVVLT